MNHNTVSLDWLEFTFKCDDVPVSWEECPADYLLWAFHLNFPSLDAELQRFGVQNNRGMLGYKCVFSLGSIRVMFHPDNVSMGVHVIIPGSEVYRIPQLFELPSIEGNMHYRAYLLFEKLAFVKLNNLKHGFCRLSRIDIAFDDFEKVLDPGDYIEFLRDGLISTSCHTSSHFSSSDIHKGSTFYLGSRASGRLLRIYDKDFESDHQVKSIRYEIEYRGGHALRLVRNILDNDGYVNFYELISDMFLVKEALPFRPGSAASLSVAKHRASVNTYWAGIFETQVSRIVNGENDRFSHLVTILAYPSNCDVRDSHLRYFDSYKRSLVRLIYALGLDPVMDMLHNVCLTSEDFNIVDIIKNQEELKNAEI